MKKSKYYILLFGIITILFSACENDPWSFPDNEFTSTYFPFQSPLRTLILGDYDLSDNSNDKLLKFNIGVRVGGLYNNNKDWTVDYVLEPNLAKNLYNELNDTMRILPAAYYTLNPLSKITVPKGSFVGNIEVQLKDQFLDDPYAYKGVYVIPLKIISSTTDSILTGKRKGSVAADTADVRILSQWDIAPKNYTLFGIKFINAYHGVYLRRGVDSIRDKNTNALKLPVKIYRQSNVEKDELCYFKTIGRNKVEITGSLRPTPLSTKMIMDFAADGTCTITQSPGTSYVISGTGKFITDGDSWGGSSRDVVRALYTITDLVKNEIHQMRDTIVLRDRDVKFETFTVTVKK